jgi:hypothetical protein
MSCSHCWTVNILTTGAKRPVREADHSRLFSAEAKNAWIYTSIPPKGLHGVALG